MFEGSFEPGVSSFPHGDHSPPSEIYCPVFKLMIYFIKNAGREK